MYRPFAFLSSLLLFTAVTAKPFFSRGADSSDTKIETRTLDQIYEAAKLENTPLRVAWGGDGV